MDVKGFACLAKKAARLKRETSKVPCRDMEGLMYPRCEHHWCSSTTEYVLYVLTVLNSPAVVDVFPGGCLR